MSDPRDVVKKLQETVGLPVQVGRDGVILGEPTGYVSTRCPTLDYLIGRPGIPLGGITMIAGAYGSGKSSICLGILAEMQSRGGRAVIFDTEGRLDFTRAEKLGINLDELIVAQPNTLEDTFDGVKQMVHVAREEFEENEQIVIVLDGIAGAPLEKDLKGEKTGLGAQAILIKRELRVISNLVNRQRIGLVITSQPRQKIELGGFGRPKKHWLGEDPLGHAAMTTIYLEQKRYFGEDKASPIGHTITATLIDTRIAGCKEKECQKCTRKDFRRDFDFYDATGPDFFSSMLDVLQEVKVINYTNGWYKYKDMKTFRRDDFEERVAEWPELLEDLGTILKGGYHPEAATT